MGYLRKKDYDRIIQADNLDQITASDYTIRLLSEGTAMEEMFSYLRQKFDITQEFAEILLWERATSYKAMQRVSVDFPAYVAATSYAINDLVTNGGNSYICIATTTGAFDATKWTKIAAQYDLFFVTLPKPLFDQMKYYKKGDQVFWKDKTYTAKRDSLVPDHTSYIQNSSIEAVAVGNPLPSDTINGPVMWGTGTPYLITAATLPSDATKWTAGDGRNPQFVMYLLDICLYHIHCRIAPNNIPQIRLERYDTAIKWLDMARKGNVSPNLPIIQPRQGNRIRFGGQIKQQNSY